MDKRFERECLKDISGFLRELAKSNEYKFPSLTIEGRSVVHKLGEIAERIDAAAKRDAQRIERTVRDAIVSYQEMYPRAPNDDCERELKERAEAGNRWLEAHGLNPEVLNWSREEAPQL